MILENIKSEAELSQEPAQENVPAESLPEKETEKTEEPNVSEDAKTQADDGFSKHSRFKELIEEKNEYKTKAEELEAELARIRDEKLSTPPEPGDTPSFDTVEDLQEYLKELPKKLKAEITQEFIASQQKEAAEQQEADDYVSSYMDQIKANNKDFDDKDFAKFALENELYDLDKAMKIYSQIHDVKYEASKQGEQLGLRKASSGLKSSVSSEEPKPAFRRGQSLDDIIAEAKAGLGSY